MIIMQNNYYVYLICFVLFCNGNSLPSTKSAVGGIIKKMLRLKSLQNASPNETKEIIRRLSSKLNKSAESSGTNTNKYMKLISQGLELMANDQKTTPESIKLVNPELRTYNDSINEFEERSKKEVIIEHIADKITNLTKKYAPNAEKNQIIEILGNKLNKSVGSLGKRPDKYMKLISQGLELFSDNQKTKTKSIKLVNPNPGLRSYRNSKIELEESSKKEVIIEHIADQITNLTKKYVQDAEKNEIMEILGNKLNKSVGSLGTRSDKYIKLISKGLELMANKSIKLVNPNLGLRSYNNSEMELEEHSKKEAIKQIADKMTKLTKKYFHGAEKSGDNKQMLLDNIKRRIFKTAEKIRFAGAKDDEINKYTGLIAQGMELLMEKMTQDPSKQKRRMSDNMTQNIEYQPSYKITNRKGDETKVDGPVYETLNNNKLEKDVFTTTPFFKNDGLTTQVSCNDVFYQTCADIKSLNQFKCKDSILALDKFCDGVTDCSDGSDEGNCINEAMERLQTASSLLSRIENYLLRNCFLSDNNALLIKQNSVLYEVIQSKIDFIKKYNMTVDAYASKHTGNEVAVIINSLSTTLDSSLCIQQTNKIKAEEEAHRIKLFDMDDLYEFTKNPFDRVSLKDCACSGSYCVNNTCSETCMRVCWHKHNLGRWICQVIDKGTSVPLDVVCDGKIDCSDETDENDCTGSGPRKFQANTLFDNILKSITKKSNTKEYFIVKQKLISLATSVLQLQKVAITATSNTVDVVKIKQIRDMCYETLRSIYNDIVNKANDVEALDDAHFFLLNVNEQLMSALKHSHTGNNQTVSPDECYCRRDKCASRSCSSSCIRVCTVKPKLTRYWCERTDLNNISIPIDAICDQVTNCPFDDDEKCSLDVCRKHHLILLQHNIRDVGEKHKGTSLGEVILTWKSKVTTALESAENNNSRVTSATIRELVKDMLNDLVLMYASFENTRRINNVFQKLFEISQQLIENLKSCAN